MRVVIDDTGLQRYARDVRGRFARLGEVMADRLRPVFRAAIIEQFETEGAYGGSPWPALAPSTIERKRAHGLADRGILRFTDRLFDAFLEPESPDLDVEVLGREFTYVILVPYAFRHQQGTPGRMPAREIVPDPMPASFIAQVERIISGYLIGVELVEGELP